MNRPFETYDGEALENMLALSVLKARRAFDIEHEHSIHRDIGYLFMEQLIRLQEIPEPPRSPDEGTKWHMGA